jgi:hypothetical protein
MSQVVIENPIINTPFHEPTRHFRFNDEGITNEIVDGRRVSTYFVPIACTKKKTRPPRLPLPVHSGYPPSITMAASDAGRLSKSMIHGTPKMQIATL